MARSTRSAPRSVVLAASACESARLMLNSKSPRHPNGLSNSSGQLGKNLTDSTGLSVGGFIPKLLDMPAHNEDGTGGMHLFMPWWLDNKKLNFPRGYHIEIGGGRDMPGYGFGGGIQCDARQHGRRLRREAEGRVPALLRRVGRLRRTRRDGAERRTATARSIRTRWTRYGIPVLRFHWKWGESEILQAKHMQETFREIIQQMGGEPSGTMPGSRGRLRARGRRPNHSRGRLHAHGRRPEDVGAERVVPGARGEKRRCLRRRSVRHQRRQELHVDDHGAGLADQHAPGRRDEEGERVAMEITRRNALKIIGATPVAAGLGLGDHAVANRPPRLRRTRTLAASRRTRRQRPSGPYKPKFFTAHEYATVTLLGQHHHPERRSLRQRQRRRRAAVHRLHDDRSPRPADADARRPALARPSRRARGSASRLLIARRRTRTRFSTTSRIRTRATPEFTQGAAFFASMRDLVATGFFTSRMGIDDIGYMGNRRRLGRLPDGVPRPPGAQGMRLTRRDAVVAASRRAARRRRRLRSRPTRPSWGPARCRGRP